MPGKSWFGQPPGLVILFLTETWEKFSYFGMRAILIYYMTQELLLGQERSSLIYGTYTAIVYLTPILGGMISDRWLGRRRSVIIGGVIMACGHFMMVFDGLLYPALATIAIGNGLFLPSLPSQISSLYDPSDPRRASAYNIYYVGVNLGGFFAPLVCGSLGELYGWHWGFAAAGIGMIVGLLIYIFGARHLPPDRRDRPESVPAGAAAASDSLRCFTLLACIAAIIVVFRAAYEQVGNTVALWAGSGVDRSIATAWTVPMTWFQSLNPMLVFLLTPLLVAYWTRQARRANEPSALIKMTIGAAVVGVAYLLLAAVAAWSEAQGIRASWLWFVLFFVIMTGGELWILPVGLGLFGRLAPAHRAATTIATWYLAAFAGNLLAGVLGTFWARFAPSGFFAMTGAIACLAALLLLALERRSQDLRHLIAAPQLRESEPARLP